MQDVVSRMAYVIKIGVFLKLSVNNPSIFFFFFSILIHYRLELCKNVKKNPKQTKPPKLEKLEFLDFITR